MLKNSKILLFFFVFLFSKTIFASSSASFLIAQTAFNNYDFSQVLNEYSSKINQEYKNDYLDELVSAVITENNILSENISKKILAMDPENQEAKLLLMVKFINSNNKKNLRELRFDADNQKNDLFEFIFFLNDQVKSKIDISNSFLEIVRSSYSKQSSNYSQNYNFLLFYTSLAILVNNQNYEAIFIKGQLLQMIDDYIFAEVTYQKIPKQSEYFTDAQRNIAFNYSRENGFDDIENKIKLIIANNNEDYEINKILADFYRIEKKFDLAIKLYSELIQKNPNDLWYTLYLRGICYEQSDNWEKAEVDFLQSLKIKRDSPNVLNYLAYGWLERDIRIDESFVMLVDANNANPDSHYILDSLAWAYFKKKNYVKAAELMEEVIDMVPGEAISLDHLGDIYLALNRKREAIYFWRQAKDLAKPEDEITENIQKKLSEHDAS
ncbi:MAG: tetratricopeptide repeat protein [Alphaproteobacteria bacterium]|jgi:Flp pilus assembly protein TadD|nr:tetratricopeptide repeat protein [Alphaproteobacteria bacterium]